MTRQTDRRNGLYRRGDGQTFRCDWTNEQVTEILGSALAVVESLQPPEDLRGATFQAALNMAGQMQPVSGIQIVKGE